MIIGITGHPGSGKDAAAEYFVRHGFHLMSGGDFVREIMRKEGIPTDREHVHEFFKKMRGVHGNVYPAHEIVEKITGNTVTAGMRNMAEVAIFRKKFGKDFILLAIDAPLEIRYERVRQRGREGDNISFELFKEQEDRERNMDSGTHEVDTVISAADATILNTGTKEELFAKLNGILMTGRSMTTI